MRLTASAYSVVGGEPTISSYKEKEKKPLFVLTDSYSGTSPVG